MQLTQRLKQLNVPLGTTIKIAKTNYLYFGGTAYLGIPTHKGFLKLYLKGIKKFGLNNGTSRGSNLQLGIYQAAETFAANKFEAPAALITSSGYLAAQLTTKYFAQLGTVRYAPATHPALWQNQTPTTTGSFLNWSKNLVIEINSSRAKKWIIISNSLNNLFPEVYDFNFLSQINSNKEVVLIVDDSHGIGIINNGKGVFSTIAKLKNLQIVAVASMAKALGVDAGLVLGSKKTISALKNTAEFLGASPPAAAGLYAFMEATNIYHKQLLKLQANTNLFALGLKNNANFKLENNFPVYLSTNKNLHNYLQKLGILISAFAYPNKNGAVLNRIVLSSAHKKTEIKKLLTLINNQ